MQATDLRTYTLKYAGGFEENWTPQPGALYSSMILVALELLEDAGIPFRIDVGDGGFIADSIRDHYGVDEGMTSDGRRDPPQEHSEKSDIAEGTTSNGTSDEEAKEDEDLEAALGELSESGDVDDHSNDGQPPRSEGSATPQG